MTQIPKPYSVHVCPLPPIEVSKGSAKPNKYSHSTYVCPLPSVEVGKGSAKPNKLEITAT